MATKREILARVCEVCGGTHTDFSQSWADIKRQRQMAPFYNDKSKSFEDKTYIGGMCHSMSLYWLALRKKGDRTFFSWLKPNGQWDKGAINVLVIKTGMYKNGKNQFVSADAHKDFDDRFFAHYGLHRYGAKLSGANNVLKYLANATPGYHMVSLSRDGGGHAVAAHITDNGACAFFDPNYGEYAFPNKLFFGTFMKTFMEKSGYGAKYTKAQSIETFR